MLPTLSPSSSFSQTATEHSLILKRLTPHQFWVTLALRELCICTEKCSETTHFFVKIIHKLYYLLLQSDGHLKSKQFLFDFFWALKCPNELVQNPHFVFIKNPKCILISQAFYGEVRGKAQTSVGETPSSCFFCHMPFSAIYCTKWAQRY